YVAVTRSLYRCYLGVIVSSVASTSALHRLLNLEALGNEDDAKAYCERFTAAMRHQCSKASNNLVFRKAQARTSEHYSTTNKDPILLHQTSTRKVTPTWQMSSFSRITKTSENAIVQARDSDDTPENDKRLIAIEKLIDHESLLRFKMTPGADSGNLLHDSLENIDFQRPDFQSAWNDIRGKYSWFDVTMLNELSSWLTECLVTPILNDGCSLAKLTSSAVLKESNFYMPSTAVPGRDFVRLLTAHRENIKQVCNLSNVKTPFFIDQKTNLMLQGFIDLVFEHKGKYYVVDYKSSFLGPTFEDYSAKRIWENMQSHNYDLQYHLYTLALHRLLQQRIDDYSPATHLGGVIYLYLRGMHPDKPQCGVFFSPLDTLCLKEIDDLFESGK
ncbi:MAG: PD-(D/E)XK nuclease family protein, partial [Pseudomonadota bacterium]